MNTLFCNLKVISQLEPDQKLYVSDKELVIDVSNYLSPISRWWYDENRDKTLERITELAEEAIQNGNNAIRSESGNDYRFLENSETNIKLREWELERDTITSTTNIGFLEHLISELTNLIQGIETLRKTYESDKTLCSKLEVIVQNLNSNIDKFKNFLLEHNGNLQDA